MSRMHVAVVAITPVAANSGISALRFTRCEPLRNVPRRRRAFVKCPSSFPLPFAGQVMSTPTKSPPTLAQLSENAVSAVPRSKQLYEASLANAVAAAQIADQLRGQNIVILDLTKITSIVDFFVIATGTSLRQMHAIADDVNFKLKHEDGNRRISIEGYRTQGNWILTDYGDVVLHVFTAEGRLLYNLEQLWADAPRIAWEPLAPAAVTETPE